MQCALLFRFRSIDRFPEPPSAAAVRGTLVHAVLEDLFDHPAPHRTAEAARALLPQAWERLQATDPSAQALVATQPPEPQAWLSEAQALLEAYFRLEDPRGFDPEGRELLVEWQAADDLLLRGYIDRVDRASTGQVRVVDYKTGRAPKENYEAKALFQMRFYALLLWRSTGEVPALLQLLYLGSGETLRYSPDEADLLATERKVRALWQAITQAFDRREFRPSRSALCAWCSHQARCPEFGGVVPDFPSLPVQGAQDAALTDPLPDPMD